MGTNSTELVSREMMITPVGALEDFVYAAIRAGWFTNKEISGHPDGFKKRLVLDLGCALRQRSAARCKKTGCQFLKLRPNNQALQERQLADLLYRDKPTVHNAAGRIRQAVDDFLRRLGPY